MMTMKSAYILFFAGCLIVACSGTETPAVVAEKDTLSATPDSTVSSAPIAPVQVGAERMNMYLEELRDKKVAVVANQTSMVGNTHLVDTLHASGIKITKVFALEHGFRGEVQAGEHVKSTKDQKTGIPIVSLYGNNKKPKAEVLKDVDVIVFDIQDVGARFYTYISSLHYIMESAAEHKKKVMVLDRPNPNGFYVDGPVLDTAHRSFVGMHPVPVVHGMTIGEYASMINGEGWLKNKVHCELEIISCLNYTHETLYELPVKPSPNLVNMKSIYLYPSLCLFEGTTVSVARGTDFPFQAIGMPGYAKGDFTFTPKSVKAAKTPPHQDKECKGYDLRSKAEEVLQTKQLNISWLIEFYNNCPDKSKFFESDGMFTLLSGGKVLRTQIEKGMTEQEIRASWEPALSEFKEKRKKYLLYP